MAARTLALLVVALSALVACQRSNDPQSTPAAATEPAPAVAQAPDLAKHFFVNRVWAVVESRQVAVGDLHTFLSDGTLVMTSSRATPEFGTWRHDGDSLTIVEDGREYPTDILELTEQSFRIRVNGPGEPVEILFAPAEQVPKSAVQTATPVVAAPAAAVLWGTGWRLENLAGTDVLDGVEATLEFPSEGRANGNGSCNRFNGVVTIEGDTIRFGGVAATRMACPDAVMRQEDAYFAALRDAERFETDGQVLRIFSAGQAEPLRFVASPAPTAPAANQISRASATAAPSLTGIWTVVGHHNPGTSTLGDDQAQARYGETLRLTASAAISPGSRCGEPVYAAQSVPAAVFLASEYKLEPGSLKWFAGRNQIRLMDVSCGDAPWKAFGARLLEIDRDRALAPWDGVFFELVRDRDFRAVGQEPGWQLEIRQGAEMRFTFDYGKNSAVTPAARVNVDPGTGTRTYHAVAEANDLRVEIVPVACTDTMSGRPFATTVTVTLNGRSYRGCGEGLATPFQG
jgi:heat shock protein HslJ